jgi:ribosomal protein S18 acetylase RimI-like enzyme
VFQYRTFRNTDPPALARVWNQALPARGAVPLPTSSPLEQFVFSKPYFDPAGLVLAEEGDRLVGFAHAGFGPNADESALSTATGVICMVAVIPSHRRRGVGSELLRRGEDYLRQRGAQAITAGGVFPFNPFYFGLYGGSESAGFLESNATAGPFLARHKYRAVQTYKVLHRSLRGSVNVADGRFAALRRRCEFRVEARTGPGTWWREAVLGPLELHDFRLEEKATGQPLARATVWEMEGFSRAWNEPSVGLVEVEVAPGQRRQGLAKFLLAQTCRYLQDQYFTMIEVQTPESNEAAVKLYHCLGFQPVDTGHVYRRESEG